jgi:hypothetical protein
VRTAEASFVQAGAAAVKASTVRLTLHNLAPLMRLFMRLWLAPAGAGSRRLGESLQIGPFCETFGWSQMSRPKKCVVCSWGVVGLTFLMLSTAHCAAAYRLASTLLFLLGGQSAFA